MKSKYGNCSQDNEKYCQIKRQNLEKLLPKNIPCRLKNFHRIINKSPPHIFQTPTTYLPETIVRYLKKIINNVKPALNKPEASKIHLNIFIFIRRKLSQVSNPLNALI